MVVSCVDEMPRIGEERGVVQKEKEDEVDFKIFLNRQRSGP